MSDPGDPDLSPSAVAERYATIAAGFSARVAGIGPDGWSAPSPCTEWTARHVVAHVIDTHRRVLSMLDGSEPAAVGPDDDLPSGWAAAADDLSRALADPQRATAVVHSGFGEQPFASLVGRLLCADTLLHTWDLARATGQDERLDPGAVSAALAMLTPIDEAIRRPGGFAAKLEPPPGADAQARLLAFCGRAA